MKSDKYYIMKRNSPAIMNDYLADIVGDKAKILKRLDSTKPLLLLEKTANKENTEHFTNMWTLGEGCESIWTEHTKGKMMYDYTGIVYPLIHVNGTVYTWEQYNALKNI